MLLHWSQILHCFALNALSGTPPYIFIPLFVPSRKSLHRSLLKHISFALLSSSDVVLYAILPASNHLLQVLPLSDSFRQTSDSHTILVNLSPIIGSTCKNHFKTFRSTHSSSISHLLCTSLSHTSGYPFWSLRTCFI